MLKSHCGPSKRYLYHVTAEKIYSYLRQTQPDAAKIAEIRGIFYADNHEIWYMTGEEKESRFGLAAEGSGEADGESQSEAAADWQSVAERMQVDLETFGKQRGLTPGAMTLNLTAVNREKYDYSAFLKKFAVMGEQMRINDDEFDYIYYTYGLQLYEKMPLIEPLEYKNVKAIREFVIAIDTSGSTSGALVQKFVQKTYNILKSTESFFTKINLHIIQCDADIQEDKKITCQEDFDEYLKTLYHYHTSTRTGRVEGLMNISGHSYVELNPVDAARLEVVSGERVRVSSRRGSVEVEARVTDIVAEGVLFMPFHFADGPANLLTNTVVDPTAKIPELQVCAARIEKI